MAKNQGRGQKLQQLEPFCTRCPHFTVVIFFRPCVQSAEIHSACTHLWSRCAHVQSWNLWCVLLWCAVCLKLGSDFVSVSHMLCRSPGFGCQRLPGDGAALRHSIDPPRSRADAVDEGSGQTLYHPHRQLLWQKGENKKKEWKAWILLHSCVTEGFLMQLFCLYLQLLEIVLHYIHKSVGCVRHLSSKPRVCNIKYSTLGFQQDIYTLKKVWTHLLI